MASILKMNEFAPKFNSEIQPGQSLPKCFVPFWKNSWAPKNDCFEIN